MSKKKTKTKSSQRYQILKSDGVRGLELILTEIKHFQKHRDSSGLLALLTQSSQRDFLRLKQIILASTNIEILENDNQRAFTKIKKIGKVKLNDNFRAIESLQQKGNVSFRSNQLDPIIGVKTKAANKNFNSIRAIEKMLDEAKAADEPIAVIQALQVCWVKIKAAS